MDDKLFAALWLHGGTVKPLFWLLLGHVEADLCRSAPVGAESVFRAAGFALVADAPGTVEATVGAIAEATASATAALLTAPRRLPGCCPAWALHDRHAAAETQPVYRPRTAALRLR